MVTYYNAQLKGVVKNLKIGIKGLEIETKKKHYTITNMKGIISFFQAFYMYT